MDLLQANIFKAGIFKKAKYMLSAPQQAGQVLFFSETGVCSLELLPLKIGYVVSHKVKMAWNVIQKLKIKVEGIDGFVIPISERSRIPLDPYNILTEEEKQSLASPDTIHSISYARAWADIKDRENESPNSKAVMSIIWILGVLIGLGIIALFIKGVL